MSTVVTGFSTKRNVVLLQKCLGVIFFISTICFSIPLVYSVYTFRDNMLIFPKSTVLSFAVLWFSTKIIIVHKHKSELQVSCVNYKRRRIFTIIFVTFVSVQRLFGEMKEDLKTANTEISASMSKKVEKFVVPYFLLIIASYAAAFFVCIVPLLINDQSFPSEAIYPFEISESPIRELIYIHQTFVGLQVSASLCFNIWITVLFWYMVCNFELLAKKLVNVRTEEDFNQSVRKHQQLLRYELMHIMHVYLNISIIKNIYCVEATF